MAATVTNIVYNLVNSVFLDLVYMMSAALLKCAAAAGNFVALSITHLTL